MNTIIPPKFMACLLMVGAPLVSNATIIVNDFYFGGEADPGAVAGNITNGSTVDSAPSPVIGNLSQYGPSQYSADVSSQAAALGSTLSLNLTPDNSYFYQNMSLSNTNNIGFDGFFKFASIAGESIPFYMGNTAANGMGMYVQNGTLKFLFGGTGILDSGIVLSANQWYYIGFVVDGGNFNLYLNGTTAQNLGTGSFGAASAYTQVGGLFKGYVDNLRLFTFASGEFSSCDLQLAAVPEPSTMVLGAVGLLVVGGRIWRRRRQA